MRSTKQINVENRPCYFFNVTQIILQFLIQVLCIDKLSFKSTDIVIYNIRYIATKSLDHVNTDLLLQTKTEGIRKNSPIETINGGQQIKYKKDFIKTFEQNIKYF